MTCKRCGDKSTKEYCDFCDKLYFKRIVETPNRTIKKPEKSKPNYKQKICKDCKKSFIPTSQNIRCKECGIKFKNRPPQEKWISKQQNTNHMDSDAVYYSFFRKKYGVPNNVFRG